MGRNIAFLLLIGTIVGALVLIPNTTYADEDKATWYGPGFHGRVMANGQIYDMYDPTTTASNKFPFGTWVTVTSVRTGRSVTVQVRDRGGFNHAFDLSYAAFAAIDDPALMMIPVRYEVVPGPPEQAPQPAPTPAPSPSPQPTEPPRSEPPSRSDRDSLPAEHLVQRGETLWIIANHYGLTTGELAQRNGLGNANVIVVGQRLKLTGEPTGDQPGSGGPAASRQHVVEPGQTLGMIAKLYDVPIAMLISLNSLSDPNHLASGQTLRLPDSAKAPPAAPPTPAPAPSVYVVKAGDTLGEIAYEHGTTVSALIAANGLANADAIVEGQELRLEGGGAPAPVSTPEPSQTYVVQAGDTLSGIAAQNGTTVQRLQELNSLSELDYLVEGQSLQVPFGQSAAPPQPQEYEVQPGDTLSGIADEQGTTVAALIALNGLDDPDQVRPGDRLRLR